MFTDLSLLRDAMRYFENHMLDRFATKRQSFSIELNDHKLIYEDLQVEDHNWVNDGELLKARLEDNVWRLKVWPTDRPNRSNIIDQSSSELGTLLDHSCKEFGIVDQWIKSLLIGQRTGGEISFNSVNTDGGKTSIGAAIEQEFQDSHDHTFDRLETLIATIEKERLWSLAYYPNTPVAFCLLHDHSFENFCGIVYGE